MFYSYLYIYFWLCWVFVAVCGLSLVAARGGYSVMMHWFLILWWLLLLRSTGFSSYGSWALELGLSSWGAQASLLWGMWYLPWPGIEPMTPALAGRLLTTGTPGKSLTLVFFDIISSHNNYYFCFKCSHPKQSVEILCSKTTIFELIFPL